LMRQSVFMFGQDGSDGEAERVSAVACGESSAVAIHSQIHTLYP
jgi:hypothetical protein